MCLKFWQKDPNFLPQNIDKDVLVNKSRFCRLKWWKIHAKISFSLGFIYMYCLEYTNQITKCHKLLIAVFFVYFDIKVRSHYLNISVQCREGSEERLKWSYMFILYNYPPNSLIKFYKTCLLESPIWQKTTLLHKTYKNGSRPKRQ